MFRSNMELVNVAKTTAKTKPMSPKKTSETVKFNSAATYRKSVVERRITAKA